MNYVGQWWSDSSIEMMQIEGNVYALYGWNGEKYINCWKCIGDNLMQASEEEYHIIPTFKGINGEYKITGYEIE